MMKLEGQTALITGATGGIGNAIVQTLFDAGAKVVATGTKQNKLDELRDKFGARLEVVRCDLTRSDEVEALFEQAEQIIREEISIVICNAGFCQDSLAIRMSDEKWSSVINLDLNAVFQLNRAAIKKMLKRKYGRIINISSIVGFTGNIGQANYAAAKAGMIGMSKSLAAEVATRGVTINCIAPGFIESPMIENLSVEVKESILRKIPMGAMGKPADVAVGVLFLAAKESSYITGQTLHINGGMLMP